MFTDGWDAPVGTAAERHSPALCSGMWRVPLAFGTWYLLQGKYPAIHTGIDAVLAVGSCYGQPLYAPANGIVTFARDVTGTTWRKLLVIAHTARDGSMIYSRYGHLADFAVGVGQAVTRGQLIGHIGDSEGAFAPHLHFDLSPSAMLKTNPTHWPGDNLPAVQANYVDPIKWIKEHRPLITQQLDWLTQAKASINNAGALVDQVIASLQEPIPDPDPEPVPTAKQAQVTAVPSLRVRESTSTSAAIVGQLATNAIITVVDAGTADGLTWCKITAGTYQDKFVAKNWLSFL